MSVVAKAASELRTWDLRHSDAALAELLGAIDSGANDQDVRELAETFSQVYLDGPPEGWGDL